MTDRGKGPVKELWAWTLSKPNGDEMVIVDAEGGFIVQFVSDSRDSIEHLRPFAQQQANRTGYLARLKMFTTAVTLDELQRDG